MKKIFLSVFAMALCLMLCVVGLSACGENNSEKSESGSSSSSSSSSSSGIQTIAVESVTLDKTAITLEIGGEETLTATVTPDNATDKAVAWSSDNTAVATVADGKVTAVSAGTATVTATADGKSATCSVTVNAPAPITEVTAEQWTKIMESADNFTYDNIRKRPGIEPLTATVKIDGAKRMQIMNGRMQIFVKEGTEYYKFSFFNGEWTKDSLDEARYEASNASASLISYFKDDFAYFDYADGKYVATTLDKTTAMNSVLNNVEVSFENSALVGITFSIGSGENSDIYEVKDVGTTTITLPTDYTEVKAPTTEVTAEELKQIFIDANDPEKTGGNMSVTIYEKETESAEFIKTESMKYDWKSKAFEYELFEGDIQTEHSFAIYENGKAYQYTQPDGKAWLKEEWYIPESEKAFFINLYDGVWLEDLVNNYSNFKYDKDTETYVGAIDDQTTANIYIADGKLVYIEARSAQGITKFVFSDYDATTITLPTDYTEVKAPTTEVTAEQWAKIMVSADNFTFINSLGEQSMTAKIDGATRSQGRDGMEQIFVVEGDKYFSYDNFDGKWKKSSITEEVYGQSESVAQTVVFFRDDFASFDYVEGKYVATALDKMDTMNGVLNNVEIAFENGALVSIKFSVTYGVSVYNCEIINVGTTEITLPEDYTDPTAGV